MNINDFIKLNFLKKMILIENKAILMEIYSENQQKISTYYIFDFFVEVIVSEKSQYITDIIPYKRGFKVKEQSENLLLSA